MNRRAGAKRVSQRARWRNHVAAQRVSGLTRAAYCREYRLNAKYFSRWKRVLSCAMRGAVATPDSPALIPVVLKPELAPFVWTVFLLC